MTLGIFLVDQGVAPCELGAIWGAAESKLALKKNRHIPMGV
jgi:hypothetical protein